MKDDTRTERERFVDFAKALVKVPKDEVTAQPKATRPPKAIKRSKA